MKRIIAIILSLSMLLTACGVQNTAQTDDTDETYVSSSETDTGNDESVADAPDEDMEKSDAADDDTEQEFSGLDDTSLLRYVENMVYSDLIDQLASDDYLVENVTATYISKEYLEEVAYNSQTNIYFGYTLEELENEFQGTKYIFTLGDDGTTNVQPFEDYDDTYNQIVRNVVVGTGVILVCVTVSSVSGVAGAQAISMIFAASAKTGTTVAVSSGLFSGVAAGIITGIQTGDFNETIKAAELEASEGFKWGAISGSISGGAFEFIGLSWLSKVTNLTMNQIALIQKESKWSLELIAQLENMEQYEAIKAGTLGIKNVAEIYKDSGWTLNTIQGIQSVEEYSLYQQAGLQEVVMNGKACLIQTIDLEYVSDLGGQQVTNLERIRQGYAAIDPLTDEAYELHHIGQTVDSPLAMLTVEQHRLGESYSILHDSSIESGVHSLLSDSEWASQRQEFWKGLYEILKP